MKFSLGLRVQSMDSLINCVGCDLKRRDFIFRKKSTNKIKGLETNNKNKNPGRLCIGINEFKNSYWSENDLVKMKRAIYCKLLHYLNRADIAQLVYRLATGSMVRGSNTDEERFSAPLHPGSGVHPPFYTMENGSFPGVKRPGFRVNHQSLSSTEVTERVELFFYSPSHTTN
jgi:hypothetical protein